MPLNNIGMILTALAVCIGLYSQVSLYRADAARLMEAQASLVKQAAETGKAEKQLDALATGTAKLASQGNANAQQILATLKRNGINVNVK